MSGDGTIFQSSSRINPGDYAQDNICFPVVGIVLRVFYSDDPNNRSAAENNSQRGYHTEAQVLVIHDGTDTPWFLPHVKILPVGPSGVDNFHEELPKGCSQMLDGSQFNAAFENINYELLDGDFCLAPHTKVLCSDLIWRKIEELSVGDEVIGFDEGLGKSCKIRPAMVEKTKKLVKNCYKIKTSKGEIIASEDHMWVARKPFNNKSSHKKTYRKRSWVETKSLKQGDMLAHFVDPWEVDSSWEGGYLAGFMDGEGYVGRTSLDGGVGFGQNPGPTLDYVKKLITEKGFTLSAKEGNLRCEKYRITGNRSALRFLGSIRPSRLLAKSRKHWENTSTKAKNTETVIIESVEFIGPQEVVAIQTSTRTFIAEGFLSHNCVIQFLGGNISNPIMTNWYPHPGNRRDPATNNFKEDTLIQARRLFKRYQGTVLCITSTGDIYIDTNEANSGVKGQPQGYTRQSREGGGRIDLNIKRGQELEVNFNPTVDNPNIPSLPQANPPVGEKVRETSSTVMRLSKDDIKLIAGQVVTLIGKQVTDSIVLGANAQYHALLGERVQLTFNELVRVFNELLLKFNAHVHVDGSGGITSSPADDILQNTIITNPLLPPPLTPLTATPPGTFNAAYPAGPYNQLNRPNGFFTTDSGTDMPDEDRSTVVKLQ